MKTKSVTYKNSFNGDHWVCDDPRKTKIIDGVAYIIVRKPNNARTVMMRKDSLQPVKTV